MLKVNNSNLYDIEFTEKNKNIKYRLVIDDSQIAISVDSIFIIISRIINSIIIKYTIFESEEFRTEDMYSLGVDGQIYYKHYYDVSIDFTTRMSKRIRRIRWLMRDGKNVDGYELDFIDNGYYMVIIDDTFSIYKNGNSLVRHEHIKEVDDYDKSK